ncbi:MAG: zf-TFIIB domain-containing protein [Cyanobacteria bacterium]|nr:zf-TFIIB domain-containing protein [Cyanobacteriota bacterium]
MADLQCPKCQAVMRSYERNGITVDQCTGCSGIFLDRGELERLIQAEDVHYSGGGQGGPSGDPQAPRRGFLDRVLGGHHSGYGRRGHH